MTKFQMPEEPPVVYSEEEYMELQARYAEFFNKFCDLKIEHNKLKDAARLALDALEKGFMGPNYTKYFAAINELKAVL